MIEVIAGNIAHAALMAETHASASPAPWSVSAYEDSLKNPNVSALLALDQGAPMGFVLVQKAADEAEILMIVTHPLFQGHGIGQSLVVSVSKQMKQAGVKALFLEVAEDNAPARALYAKCGFAPVGRRKNYYPRGTTKVDALLLRLDLVETSSQTG